MGDEKENTGEDPSLSIEISRNSEQGAVVVEDVSSRSHNGGIGALGDDLEVAALQDHFTLFAVSLLVLVWLI